MVKHVVSTQGKTLPTQGKRLGSTLGKQLPEAEGHAEDDENEHEADEGNEDVNQVPGDDDDEPDEDLEPEQEAAAGRKRTATMREGADDEAFEDEQGDEDEEEEDNEEEEAQHVRSETIEDRSSRKSQRQSNPFIDEEAEIQEQEDEEDEDMGEDDDLLADDDVGSKNELEQAKKEAAARADLHRKQRQQEENLDPEEIERYYRRMGQAMELPEGQLGETLTDAEKASLLPSMKDPKLFAVPVSKGKEREVVICVMQKHAIKAREGGPLPIYSAVAQDYLSGKIYIEAYKEDHVKRALESIRHVHHSKAVSLVPMREMPAAVSVQKKAEADLQSGGWARFKSGIYKDDLAKILWIRSADNRALVQFVPRLDYEAIQRGDYRREKNSQNNEQDNHQSNKRSKRQTKKPRPPQKLFRAGEARNYGLDVYEMGDRIGILNDTPLQGKRIEVLNGNYHFVDGYVIKRVSVRFLKGEPSPPIEDVQRWVTGGAAEAGTPEDLQKVATMADNSEEKAERFTAGDPVYVADSDLQNLEGRVKAIPPQGVISVGDLFDPTEGKYLPETLDFRPSQLRKNFKTGDFVRVTVGQHKGETGMVSHVDKGVCTIFTDIGKEEIQVFMRDLANATEISGTTETLGGYGLYDLVELEGSQVGCIVKVERDTVQVLMAGGTIERPNVKTGNLPDIKRKVINRKATARDIRWMEVKVNDMVEIAQAEARGQKGTVLHISQGNLFLRMQGFQNYGGVRCIRAGSCRVHGGKASTGSIQSPGPGGGGPVQSSGFSAPMSPSQQAGAGGMRHGQPAGRSGGLAQTRKDMIDKDVSIMKGYYKRYRGKVKDVTDTHARVELQANSKMVTVPIDAINFPGSEGQRHTTTVSGPSGARTPGRTPTREAGGMTPSHAPMTPSHGGAMTPSHYGAMTPSHYGAMTPGRETSAMTPSHPGLGVGSEMPQVRLGESQQRRGPSGPVTSGGQELFRGMVVKLASGDDAVVDSVPEQGTKVQVVPAEKDDWGKVVSVDRSKSSFVEGESLATGDVGKDESVRVLSGAYAGKSASVLGKDGAEIVVCIDEPSGEQKYEVVQADSLAQVVNVDAL